MTELQIDRMTELQIDRMTDRTKTKLGKTKQLYNSYMICIIISL